MESEMMISQLNPRTISVFIFTETIAHIESS